MITLEQLKTLLDIAQDDTESDDFLNQIIDASVSLMERYIGNKIMAADVTETLNGSASHVIALTYYPVISMTLARDLTMDKDILSSIVLESNGATGLVRCDSDFFYADHQYKFAYRAGYETMPPDIAYAQLLLSQHLYYQTDRVKGGVQSVVTPDGSYVYDTHAIPLQVQQILDRYRKHYF